MSGQRLRIGLTGGVAAGKSEVAQILRDLGCFVIDADELAHQVLAEGTVGLAEVTARFGLGVMGVDGALNRAALAEIVFADRQSRQDLEAIVHPKVRLLGAELEKQAPLGAVVVHEIPLLVETGQAEDFDAVIVVEVPLETQIHRLMKIRGWTREAAMARIAAQASQAERRAIATYVLDNTGTHEDLRQRVSEVFVSLIKAQQAGH